MAEVIYHAEARAEYLAEVDWYEARSPKSATRFIEEIQSIERAIRANPDRYGYFERPFHEAGLRRFPFSVVYRVEPGGTVTVYAVAHASREPGYWRGRAG